MNVGKDFGKACEQAKANARLDDRPRFLHTYNGVFWLGKEAPRCEHWMVTPGGDVLPYDSSMAEFLHERKSR